MPIAKITGQGLMAIAFAVALLWGCVIGERRIERRATVERVRVLRDIERLQREQRLVPVAAPLPLRPRPARVSAG